MSAAKHTPGPWRINGILQNTGSLTIGAPEQRIVIADVHNAASFGDFIGAALRGRRDFGAPDTATTQLANANLIAAAPDLLAALKECIDLAWVETREVHFDTTIHFSHSHDFEGWESRRQEIHTSIGSYAVWPAFLGGSPKWSAYGGPDGALWFEKFDSEAAAKDCVLKELAFMCPTHPSVIASAAIAKAEGRS